jgi:nitroimidazol reductase NimA-like FMN-containing flavoprotein (pyridoxamine 5'-phosphate oxidase superfamily)
MDPTLRSKILRLLDEHRIMSLATLRQDGWPQATTVGYVSEGLRLYFICGRESQKAANIARDNRVSLTIDHDAADPMAIRGLSMAANALPIQGGETARRVINELLPKKYPEYAPLASESDIKQMAMFAVIPRLVSVLDYSLAFGHSDLVEVGPSDL